MDRTAAHLPQPDITYISNEYYRPQTALSTVPPYLSRAPAPPFHRQPQQHNNILIILIYYLYIDRTNKSDTLAAMAKTTVQSCYRQRKIYLLCNLHSLPTIRYAL